MKITTESLEGRQIHLTIELDEERTREAMRRSARRIAKQVNVPGFRKGKAPYPVILQRFGEDTIRQEAADNIAEEVYREALDQEKLDPYAAGTLDNVQYNPITLTFTVPLAPEVKLGDYAAFRLEFEEPAVPEEDIEKALDDIREENAVFGSVERAAEMGDGVAIDLEAHSDDGVELLKGNDIHLILEPGSTDPAPGFGEAIVGLQTDEEKTFPLTLTEEFPREEFRGQTAEFHVKVREIYESTVPEPDDDLARTAGNFDSIEELRDSIKSRLLAEAEAKADAAYAERVVESILEMSHVEYPPIMLERYMSGMIRDFERAVKRDAQLSLDDYLRLQDKTLEELETELEPEAALGLKRALVLGEVVKSEDLAVDSDEIGARVDEVSAPWGVRGDEVRASLNSDAGRESIRSQLLANKAVQHLVSIAKGQADVVQSEDQPVLTEESAQEGTRE